MILLFLFLTLLELVFKFISNTLKPFIHNFIKWLFATAIGFCLYGVFVNAALYGHSAFSAIIWGVIAFIIIFTIGSIIFQFSAIILYYFNNASEFLSNYLNKISAYIGRLNDDLLGKYKDSQGNNNTTIKILYSIQKFNYFLAKHLPFIGIIGVPFIFSKSLKYAADTDINLRFVWPLHDFIYDVANIHYGDESPLLFIAALIATIIVMSIYFVFPFIFYFTTLYEASKTLEMYYNVKNIFFKYRIYDEKPDPNNFDSFLYLVFYVMQFTTESGKKLYCFHDVEAAYDFAVNMFKNKDSYFHANRNGSNYQQNSESTFDDFQDMATKKLLSDALTLFKITKEQLKSMSDDELKKIRRQLMKNNHPDSGGSEDLAKKINESFDFLMKYKNTL